MTETTYPDYIPYEIYDYDETNTLQFQAQDFIYKYVFPFFLFFGTIGSITCLILLNKYSHMVWSTCFYLSLLMGIDLLILYAHCGNNWYFHVTGVNLSNEILLLSNSLCKVYNFFSNFLDHYSSWIIVCVSVDLMIAIRYPHHMYRMCTRERSQAVMLLTLVLLVCLNLHYFWTQGLSTADQDPQIQYSICHENYEVPEEFHEVWGYVQLFITHIFPLTIVLICVIMTITVIFKQVKPDDDTEKLLSKYFLDLNTLYQMKVSAGVMCVLFLPVASVRSIVIILRMLNSKEYIFINYIDFMIPETVSATIGYGFMSLKPYIFISLSSKLRKDISRIMKTLFKCRIFSSQNKQYRVSNTDCQPSSTIDDTNTKTFSKQGARPKIFTNSGTGTVTDV